MRACQVLSVVSDSLQRYGLLPARLLCPWDSPGKNTEVGILQPCCPPGDLPDPGIKPTSPVAPALRVDSSLLSHWESPYKGDRHFLK